MGVNRELMVDDSIISLGVKVSNTAEESRADDCSPQRRSWPCQATSVVRQERVGNALSR